MTLAQIITSPDDPALSTLCAELSSRADSLDLSGEWPAEQLRLLGEFGVYQWFCPASAVGRSGTTSI